MDAKAVKKLVLEKIDDQSDETNSHTVDLRSALVPPVRATMILRLVRNGKIKDSTVDVWIVLRELSECDGYTIFYDDERDEFGLASNGFPDDPYPVISGYYGDFWNTFKGM